MWRVTKSLEGSPPHIKTHAYTWYTFECLTLSTFCTRGCISSRYNETKLVHSPRTLMVLDNVTNVHRCGCVSFTRHSSELFFVFFPCVQILCFGWFSFSSQDETCGLFCDSEISSIFITSRKMVNCVISSCLVLAPWGPVGYLFVDWVDGERKVRNTSLCFSANLPFIIEVPCAI